MAFLSTMVSLEATATTMGQPKIGSAQESDDLPERLAFSEKDLWLA